MSGPSPRAQLIIASALLIVFAAVVVLMLAWADTWDQRVYVFGAVEAVVFTAVGWVFGREVNRQTAETAKQDAEEAKRDAKAMTEEVKELTKEAEKGRTLALAVQSAAADDAPAAGGGPRDVSTLPPSGAGGRDLAALKALAQKMYE